MERPASLHALHFSDITAIVNIAIDIIAKPVIRWSARVYYTSPLLCPEYGLTRIYRPIHRDGQNIAAAVNKVGAIGIYTLSGVQALYKGTVTHVFHEEIVRPSSVFWHEQAGVRKSIFVVQ